MVIKDIFENKNVALVGPAKYMETMPVGEDIDNHDVVVRINRSWESIEKFKNNIGSRTDVLYSCLIEKPANAGKIDVEKYKSMNVKLICVPPASDLKGHAPNTSLHSLVNIESVQRLVKKIPVRIVDHQFNNWLAVNVNCRPNTGYLAIYDILRMNPKKLSIYGFSFYLDGFIKGVKEGIEKEQGKSEAQFAEQCFNSKRHNQANMWKFAKDTLLENKKVVLDAQLSKILQLEKLDKNLYTTTGQIN